MLGHAFFGLTAIQERPLPAIDANLAGHRPSLIVVTGRPGAGKTTLAHALARAMRCPAVCRDEIKEGLIHTIDHSGAGGGDGGGAQHVYEAFFDVIRLLLDRRVSLVAEAAFQHKLWAPRVEPMTGIAHVRFVVCTVSPELARRRRLERVAADPDRLRYHPEPADDARGERPSLPGYDPPQLDLPTLHVDTSDGYKPTLSAIATFATMSRTS